LVEEEWYMLLEDEPVLVLVLSSFLEDELVLVVVL